MKLTENSENLTIKGYIGTWCVIHSALVVDMNKKSKKVYQLEHEEYGEDALPIFVDSKGNVLEDFEGYLMLEDIVYDMKNNEF